MTANVHHLFSLGLAVAIDFPLPAASGAHMDRDFGFGRARSALRRMLDACFGYGVTLGARHDHHVTGFERFDIAHSFEGHEFVRTALCGNVSRARVGVGE